VSGREPTAEARIARLEAQVAALLAENERLRARVSELEAQLGQNSTNSHKPPSSDPPGTRPPKNKTGRQRGAQPGHKPHRRELVPLEQVTQRTRVRPGVCKCCGSARLKTSTAAPRIHQVIEIPEIRPDVHQIDMAAAECLDCGKTTWASLPKGVSAHMFGPRLLGFIGYVLAARTSRRQLQELLSELFCIRVSLGALSGAEAKVSTALAAPVQEAVAHARAQPAKHVDASTWRLNGAYAALWTIAAPLVAVFFVTKNACAETIASLLGTVSGTLITDRGSQFGFWAMDRRQICWAHLIRKFVSFTQRKDEGARIGENLLLIAQAMISAWHQVRDGTLSREKYQQMARRALVVIEAQLARGVALDLEVISRSCKDVLRHKGALFTFAFTPGVEPTNNHAERALRPFVLWRKVSFGSQSERGCLFAERIMTVAHTLRLQRRSVFQFVVAACQAHLAGAASPSLLPAPR
jgi:transposase